MPLTLTRREGSPFWWITGTIRGRRIRESSGFADRVKAEEIRARREGEVLDEAIHGKGKVWTFADVVLSYSEHAGPHSATTRKKTLRLLDHFGRKTLAAQVDQQAIDRACAALLRPGAKPATKLREIVTPIRAILTHGARRGMCALPVLEQGRASPSRTEWLAPGEVDRLIDGAAHHLRPLLTFLAGTGVRLGEALALEWREVDLHYGTARIRQTKQGTDRIVEMCPRVLAALASITGRARPDKIGGGFYPRPEDGPVFRARSGAPYAARKAQGGGQIKTGWQAALDRSGIGRKVTPHSLRHTWASWHYACHRDPLLLRHEGGWSTISMVERYTHLAPASMARQIANWRSIGTLLTHEIPEAKKRA